MSGDIKKKLGSFFDKLDSKILESKVKQFSEMLQKGKQEELLKKVSEIDKEDLEEKINELGKLSPQELESLKEKFATNIDWNELSNLTKKLDSNSQKVLEKIITTFKKS